jgi:hypothetical protein
MKFSIRDLLWLTVVVAILVAWWIDHNRVGELPKKGRKPTIHDTSWLPNVPTPAPNPPTP